MIDLQDEVLLLRAAIRHPANAQGAGVSTDLADLRRQARALALSLRGGPESELVVELDRLVDELADAEEGPPAA